MLLFVLGDGLLRDLGFMRGDSGSGFLGPLLFNAELGLPVSLDILTGGGGFGFESPP